MTIGVPTVLTGPFAEFGEGADRGISAEVAALNAKGGLLGKQVKVVFEDDGASVPAAITNTKSMILNDHAVAIFGASTSSTGAAEEALAGQYHVPYLMWGGNDISLTTTDFNHYAFQLEPSTYMEPLAAAQYLSKLPYRRYYFITPNYSFGRDDVNSFEASMKSLGINLDILGTSYVPLFLNDYGPYISAAMATHPQIIFLGIFGGDEITFLKQAATYNLFANTTVFGPTGTDVMLAMGSETPSGIYLNDRAPFFALTNPEVPKLVNEYHLTYGGWPSEWYFLGMSAIQTWAQGVEKAHSFNGTKVADALSGATVSTIRGTFTIRPCDHQAIVPDYFFKTGTTISKYGFPTPEDVFVSNPQSTLMS